MNSRLNITLATTPLSPQSVLTRLQHQWLVISTATFIGVVLAAVAAFTVKPRFEVDAFLDKPYASELRNLCITPQRMYLHMRAGCGSIPAYAAI